MKVLSLRTYFSLGIIVISLLHSDLAQAMFRRNRLPVSMPNPFALLRSVVFVAAPSATLTQRTVSYSTFGSNGETCYGGANFGAGLEQEAQNIAQSMRQLQAQADEFVSNLPKADEYEDLLRSAPDPSSSYSEQELPVRNSAYQESNCDPSVFEFRNYMRTLQSWTKIPSPEHQAIASVLLLHQSIKKEGRGRLAPGTFLLCDDEGRLMVTGVYHVDPQGKKMVLEYLLANPSFPEKQGKGSAGIDWLERTFLTLPPQIKVLELESRLKAQGFYRKMGFKEKKWCEFYMSRDTAYQQVLRSGQQKPAPTQPVGAGSGAASTGD